MKREIKLSALDEIFYMMDKNIPITTEVRHKLLELERRQLIEAYNLDPDLMKYRYRSAEMWYDDIYGK